MKKIIKEIFLNSLNMNHFTELDAEGYCQIFNINTDDITELHLGYNKLTDVLGISIFKNLEKLGLNNNQITDLSILNNMNNLKLLDISNLNLTDEIHIVKILKNLPNLITLNCKNTFKTVDIKKELPKGINIYD